MSNMAFDYAEVIYLPNVKKKEETDIQNDSPIKKRCIKDVRIFTNTIEQAVDIMNRSGVDTLYDMVRHEDSIEITILVST